MACVFVGSRTECKSALRSISGYYVYVLRRPDGRPFYVGKGTRDRVFMHENEARHPNDLRSNIHKLNVIRSIWRSGGNLIYEIDSATDDEAAANIREAVLIAELKRLHEGGSLTNLSPGGGSSSGIAPETRERHSATLGGIPDNNPERATLNGFVLSIGHMSSVVLKPISQFRPRPTQAYSTKTIGQSPRQAIALVASAAANGIFMDVACQIPRRARVEGVDGLIENGVSCDIVTSGMATLVPSDKAIDESFFLSENQSKVVVGMVGIRKCYDLGISRSNDVVC